MERRRYTTYLFVFTWISVSVIADVCPYKECECFEGVIQCEDLNLKSLPTVVVSKVSWQPLLSLAHNFITNITAKGLPSGLGAIDFEGNPITFVDQQAFVGSEDTLTTLKFSGVNLDELPFALFFLTNLQHLSIQNSQIRQWDPSILFFLGNTLQTLTLVDVGFTSWPEWIASMQHLYVLEFSIATVSVPDDAFKEQRKIMSSLTLNNITLTSTQNIFSDLEALTDLTLDNNKISHVSGLPSFGNLTTLSLNNNSISDETQLVAALRNVSNSLGTLYLNGNQLTKVPDLSFMAKLETLSLSFNTISNTISGSIPGSVSFLGLDNNKITSISAFMRSGTRLDVVSFRSNYITQLYGQDIPSGVDELDFSHNLITALSDTCFPYNSTMQVLRLDFNPISTISSSAFANLKYLTYLTISNTKLTRLPASISSLTSLRNLDLSGNVDLVCTCLEANLRVWYMSISVVISGMCGRTSIGNFLTTLSADCPS